MSLCSSTKEAVQIADRKVENIMRCKLAKNANHPFEPRKIFVHTIPAGTSLPHGLHLTREKPYVSPSTQPTGHQTINALITGGMTGQAFVDKLRELDSVCRGGEVLHLLYEVEVLEDKEFVIRRMANAEKEIKNGR
jgi:hypothetical protein